MKNTNKTTTRNTNRNNDEAIWTPEMEAKTERITAQLTSMFGIGQTKEEA